MLDNRAFQVEHLLANALMEGLDGDPNGGRNIQRDYVMRAVHCAMHT